MIVLYIIWFLLTGRDWHEWSPVHIPRDEQDGKS